MAYNGKFIWNWLCALRIKYSTASIVASVMTTYFGLKTDIREIKTSQETETRINNIRLKILEDNVALLQKEVDEIKLSGNEQFATAKQSIKSNK